MKELYDDKVRKYFAGARKDWVDSLAYSDTARLLEVGCGTGDTCAYALRERKCALATGIEINENAACEAEGKVSRIITGDVESMALPFEKDYFDILMMSEVLEHLVDPWAVLRKLHPFLRPGALVFASSPNVSNYKVIGMLLKGCWNLESQGVMDRTHLRWFTPESYAEMFNSCGYGVSYIGPVTRFSMKKQILSWLALGRMDHLLVTQIDLRACRI